jgi:hypothetical protein
MSSCDVLTTRGVQTGVFERDISEFPNNRISMAVNHLQPKPDLNPETSKKE